MKKLLSLILCLALSLTLLVGCSEDVIGSYLENYEKNEDTVRKLTLNLYIITGDETTATAKTTVANMISSHASSEYSTVLNVRYFTESEYEASVKNAIAAGGSDAPHIILINSESLANDLINAEGGNKLLDISGYLRTKAYGKLNTQIAESLLQAARTNGKLYALPNNHVIGGNTGYEYFVINKEVAHQQLHYGKAILESYKSFDDAKNLIDEMNREGYNAEELVYSIKGSYELKAELESKGYICNVVKYPTATAADAFAGAFAIVKNSNDLYNDRAMQILYALNTDVELRNLLQYGVQGTNYVLDLKGNVSRFTEGNNVYFMNLRYTGDAFKAYFSEELGWTKDAYDNGILQNDESLVE